MTWARWQGSVSAPSCPAIAPITGGIRTGAPYNGQQEWRRRSGSSPARPAGTPYDRRSRAHRSQLALAEQRAAPGGHGGAPAAALDAAAVVPGDRQRARRQRQEPRAHRRRQERVRGLLVRGGGDLRRRRGRARPAVGPGGAQGVPPSRRRRHGDHGRRAVGHVPDLLPPARQAQRAQGRADPDVDRRPVGHLHRLSARCAARLRRLSHPRLARARARGRRRAAPGRRDRPRAGRHRP